jgi:hypothetical protein
MTTFRKPPGEQSSYEESTPVRKPPVQHRPPKRTRTPPDTEERPISQPRKTITPPVTPPASPPPPTHQEEPMHHDEEHTPRIYTEETVVNYFTFLFCKYFI